MYLPTKEHIPMQENPLFQSWVILVEVVELEYFRQGCLLPLLISLPYPNPTTYY